MKNNKTFPDKPQETDLMQELEDETLAQVSGAGNPFGDFPRVPTQPIDDDPIGKLGG